MSPARMAMPLASRALAMATGDLPSMAKVNTGTRSCRRGRSNDSQPLHLTQSRQTVRTSPDRDATSRLSPRRQEVARRGQTDRTCDVRRAGLKLQSAMLQHRTLEIHFVSHVAADLVGRHRLEQLETRPHDAGRHRAEHLVTREHVEVAAQVLHVDAHVRHRLGAIDDDARTSLPGQRADLLGGIDEPSTLDTWLNAISRASRR